MKRTLRHPLPLTPTLGRRERGRKRRLRQAALPHRTARGDYRPAPDAIAGQFRPARPSSVPVRRRDDIVTTDSAASAPTSRLPDQRWNTRLWAGGGGESWKATRHEVLAVAARRAAPLLLEAARKAPRQAAATTMTTTTTTTKTMTTEGPPEETDDREGTTGGLPRYIPKREDRWIKEVYRDWMNSKNRAYISGEVEANQECQERWKNCQ